MSWSFPESASERYNPCHNHEVCQVEYSSVKRANTNEDEVGDETLPGDAVDEVAYSAGHDQREADECQHAQPGAAYQISEQSKEAHTDTHGENGAL